MFEVKINIPDQIKNSPDRMETEEPEADRRPTQKQDSGYVQENHLRDTSNTEETSRARLSMIRQKTIKPTITAGVKVSAPPVIKLIKSFMLHHLSHNRPDLDFNPYKNGKE